MLPAASLAVTTLPNEPRTIKAWPLYAYGPRPRRRGRWKSLAVGAAMTVLVLVLLAAVISLPTT